MIASPVSARTPGAATNRGEADHDRGENPGDVAERVDGGTPEAVTDFDIA